MITVELKGLDNLEQALKSIPTKIVGGVKCSGPALAYALVWEFGRLNIQPGPKTMWSENADGQEVVLTIQAPHGYIRINRDEYIRILREEFSLAQWQDVPIAEWDRVAADVVNTASARCAEMIRDAAPIDSGDLVSSIEVAEVGDSILGEETTGALDLGVL